MTICVVQVSVTDMRCRVIEKIVVLTSMWGYGQSGGHCNSEGSEGKHDDAGGLEAGWTRVMGSGFVAIYTDQQNNGNHTGMCQLHQEHIAWPYPALPNIKSHARRLRLTIVT